MAVEKVGPWITIYQCMACRETLSWSEKMDSYGTCPYCGHYSGCTIVECIGSVRRKVYEHIPPWWKFWEKKVWHWETKLK